MTDDRLYKLVAKLTDILERGALNFMQEEFQTAEKLGGVISLIMSSYITALHNVIVTVANQGDDHDKLRVKAMLDSIVKAIPNCRYTIIGENKDA
jgi:hypothetical protein